MGLVFPDCLRHRSSSVLLCLVLALPCVCSCLRSGGVGALGVFCSMWSDKLHSVNRWW
jgi:hypothetical protein